MKLLVISQYYDPEPFRVHDLCAGLVRRGHEVQVVTGMPNYPQGTLYPGFEANEPRDEVLDGVRVHRCPIHPRKRGALHRLWNYASFPPAAKRWLRGAGDYDAVLVYQLSPVMMASPGAAYARKHRVPAALYCLDLWPESLLAGGIGKGSPVYRWFHRVSGKLYRSMDRIYITSEQFRDYLTREFEYPSGQIFHLPQYAEEIFAPRPPRTPDGRTELMFAGNLGTLQTLDTLLDAAALLRDAPVHLTIVGDGSEYDRLRKRGQALPNVTFLGRRPLAEMPDLYARADAMLVSLGRDPVLSLTLPGKVQSYMAAGKPVLGAIDGETPRVIQAADCGFCGPAEDAAALAENIRRFMACPDRERLGANARAYYLAHFTRDRFLDTLEAGLLAMTGENRP